MKELPALLKNRLSEIYTKDEMKILGSALLQEKRAVSFRINTEKTTHEEVEKALEKALIIYRKLDFPHDCYILDNSFTESSLWKLRIYKDGKIYIQSISSQIPVEIFDKNNSILNSIPLEEKESTTNNQIRILDACAAPGGKTAQLKTKYPDAEIWAFEPSKIRYEKMLYNLQKQGISTQGKSSILNSHPEGESRLTCIHDNIENIRKYLSEENYFNLILVDAPCSSEGSLALHNTKFLENWDISHINKNYKRQKRICDSVFPYLKSGGELIYSTCTLAPEENEAVIHYILCNYPELLLEKIVLEETNEVITKKALKYFGKHPYRNEISENCTRVIPSNYSEGFFIAKLHKKS